MMVPYDRDTRLEYIKQEMQFKTVCNSGSSPRLSTVEIDNPTTEQDEHEMTGHDTEQRLGENQCEEHEINEEIDQEITGETVFQ